MTIEFKIQYMRQKALEMTDLNKTLSDIDIVMNLLKYGRTRAAMTTLRALRETTLTSMGDECAEEYNTKYEN